MKVKVYEIRMGKSLPVKTITWQNGKYSFDPPDDIVLRNIVSESIMVPNKIDPVKEPEAFMKNLHRAYRSAYLMADKATDDDVKASLDLPVDDIPTTKDKQQP